MRIDLLCQIRNFLMHPFGTHEDVGFLLDHLQFVGREGVGEFLLKKVVPLCVPKPNDAFLFFPYLGWLRVFIPGCRWIGCCWVCERHRVHLAESLKVCHHPAQSAWPSLSSVTRGGSLPTHVEVAARLGRLTSRARRQQQVLLLLVHPFPGIRIIGNKTRDVVDSRGWRGRRWFARCYGFLAKWLVAEWQVGSLIWWWLLLRLLWLLRWGYASVFCVNSDI